MLCTAYENLTLSAGSIYSEAVDVEEVQAQEEAQLPSLLKRFQRALTRGEAACNGGFTDAGIRLGNLLKVRGAWLILECSTFWVQAQAEPRALDACAPGFPGGAAYIEYSCCRLHAQGGLCPCPLLSATLSWYCWPTAKRTSWPRHVWGDPQVSAWAYKKKGAYFMRSRGVG